MTPREALVDALTPLLPDSWKIVDSERGIDVGTNVSVLLKQQRFRRLGVAPLAFHSIDFVVTCVSPHEDFGKAEDQLDDAANELIHALDESGILWTEATKVLFADKYIAYDITLELESKKENDS